MSAFAGVISVGAKRPHYGVSKAMLSHAVPSDDDTLDHYGDNRIDLAISDNSDKRTFYSDERWVVVADIEAMSLLELSRQLGGAEPRSNSGKIIAAAFEKWGEGFVDKLEGAFAIALWNKPNGTLICVRDRFGQVPFAYQATPMQFAFATDFLPIVALQPNPLPINSSWIVEYINGVTGDHEGTPYEGVLNLPPGCMLKWRDGEISIHKYWSFSEIKQASDIVSISEIYESLERTVEQRLKDSNAAVMLSGGLDSSSIAVISRDVYRGSRDRCLPTISLVFDDFPENGERPYIEAVLNEGGFDPHFVNAESFDIVSEVKRIVEVQGAPAIGIGAPIFDQAILRAKQLGFESILDGHGGDEIVSSYGLTRFSELSDRGEWLSVFRELHQASKNTELSFISNFFGLYSSRGRGLLAKLVRGIQPSLRRTELAQPDKHLLRSDWNEHPSVALSKKMLGKSNPLSFRTERAYQESILSAPLQSHAFEFHHRQYRSFGIRPKFPYWDSKVVELSLRAPSQLKLKKGVPRSLIRSVMGNRLPDKVARRTSKFDFTDCFVRSLRTSSDQLHEYAADKNHKGFDYIDRTSFRSAVLDLDHEQKSVRRQAAKKIWAGSNLLLWFEFLDGQHTPLKQVLEIK